MIAGANGVLNSTDFFDSLAPSGIDRTSLFSVAGAVDRGVQHTCSAVAADSRDTHPPH